MKRADTQEAVILKHLQEHGSITSYEAFMRYGITRLSGRIFDLRRKGYAVTTVMRHKNGKHYAAYMMEVENV